MTKSQFLELISRKLVILDGATGTELAKQGMPSGVCPEKWILEQPEAIINVQSAYAAAGSDIVYAPTFGANRIKLEEFGLQNEIQQINEGLVALSKRATAQCGRKVYVFGDLAPTGRFVEPYGDLSFEEAVSIFKEQIKYLLNAKVDGIVIETMLDIQEARAALIAVKESCDLPVMVTLTYEKGGRTLNGTDPLSALITLQSLGADAIGCNCSTGPSDMIKIIETCKPYATVPLIAKPNAGIPKLIGGKTVFSMEALEFGSFVTQFLRAGVNVLGGCCGTTPGHIQEVSKRGGAEKTVPASPEYLSFVSSPSKIHSLSNRSAFTVIGERINPTGKKTLKEELRAGKLSLVRELGREQVSHGAHLLDVNMGLSGIDEKKMLSKAICELVKVTRAPLCIDSTNHEVVERALRIYPGRALLNSISAEKERIDKILPIAAKYGAMFVILPLGDEGIPETLEERKSKVIEVLNEAEKYGYKPSDVVVDGLVMTVSSNPSAPSLTLSLIKWASEELHAGTTCGLSNVSFGMPERSLLNSAFLTMSISSGLSSAIMNPSSENSVNLAFAADTLTGRDLHFKNYLNKFAQIGEGEKVAFGNTSQHSRTLEEQLYNSVVEGDEVGCVKIAEQLIVNEVKPSTIVDNYLIPAIIKVGELYDKGVYFLPQLIMSATAMRKGFESIEPHLIAGGGSGDPKAIVVLATVKGDIHDIGKNIVALMLKNYNYKVIDAGKDIAASEIVKRAVECNASIIGLSALMTTTMTEMKIVIDLAEKLHPKRFKYIIGGAVIDQAYANEIGAHAYAADAMDAVRKADSLVSDL